MIPLPPPNFDDFCAEIERLLTGSKVLNRLFPSALIPGYSCNGLYREAQPEQGTFLGPQVDERVGISPGGGRTWVFFGSVQ